MKTPSFLRPLRANYGKEVHYSKLSKAEQERMQYVLGDVLEKKEFKADVIAAFNFSYFIFKEREVLKKYFKKALKGLKKDGVFFLDIFGGAECNQQLEEETEHDDHSYFWDCDKVNPFTSEVQYYIHFKVGGVKHEQVFSYDWRMWSIREITELLKEVGFKEVLTYWEGEDADGSGDGDFRPETDVEQCESWVSYIAALN